MKKKILLAMAVIAVLTAGFITLSAFTTSKTVNSQISIDDDNWRVIRENVPYCDGDKGICEGYGKVWVNRETYQIAFQINNGNTKFDLAEYKGKDGYNMRFWYNNAYHYVNIYIPRAAFEW